MDDARAAKRLADGTRAAEEAAARIGVGVSAEAQSLFDALSKTLPVRWADTSIAVMDTVTIRPPYTPEACVGGSALELERVQVVLANERQRLTAAGGAA